MKKIIFLSLAVIISVDSLFGVPARPSVYQVKQSDGTMLNVIKKGDERTHYFTTTDGKILKTNKQGDFVYVNGRFDEPSEQSLIAHNIEKRNTLETAYLDQLGQQVPAKRSVSTASKRVMPLRTASIDSYKRNLIIIVQFKDKQFTTKNPAEVFNRRFKDKTGAEENVHSYFFDNSMGKYSPEFEVVGPVTLSQNYKYYGENVGSEDKNPQKMVSEACTLASTLVDFSKMNLSKDENGNVSSVYVIYAGEGESSSNDPNTVWPHMWSLEKPTKIGGVTFYGYACSNEIVYGELDGIGTFCHEFSHLLGLPDFYDTDYDDPTPQSYDLNSWSVMASGCYNGGGNIPAGYTALEREMLGFGTPKELKTKGTFQLNNLVQNNEFYRINTSNPKEYFLLENRQQVSWDRELPHHGMLIYHIDKSKASVWDNNEINISPSHQYVDIEEADNVRKNTTASYKGDPFPGTSNNTSFTDTTIPNSKLWNGSELQKEITKIEEKDGIISFSFMENNGTSVPAPIANDAKEISRDGFLASWSTLPEASHYEFDLYLLTPGGKQEIYTYPFNTIPKSSDGWSTNILSVYSSAPYYGLNAPALKLEKESYLETPAFQQSVTKIGFTVVSAGNNQSSLTVKGYNGKEWIKIEEIELNLKDREKKTYLYNASSLPKLPDNIVMIRFEYNKISANIALDDLEITMNGDKSTIVDAYNSRIVYDNQLRVEGLQSDQTYLYAVRAVVDGISSMTSTPIAVRITTLSLDQPLNMPVCVVRNGVLIVSNAIGHQLSVSTITGQLIYNCAHIGEYEHIALPCKGYYIVRIGAYVTKIQF